MGRVGRLGPVAALMRPGLVLSAALSSTLLTTLALTALPTLLLCHREINASIGPPFLKVPLMQFLRA
jgi:hypothetical protein